MKNLINRFKFICMLAAFPVMLNGQENGDSGSGELTSVNNKLESIGFEITALKKAVDDLAWYNRVGDVAYIDKVYITGPPADSSKITNKTAMGVQNPVKFYSYIFVPRKADPGKQYPLLVFPHGGVHGDFNTYYTHIVREMMAQGYIVIAPEYRGSSGYGKDFLRKDRLRRTGERRCERGQELHGEELRNGRQHTGRYHRLESWGYDRPDVRVRPSGMVQGLFCRGSRE